MLQSHMTGHVLDFQCVQKVALVPKKLSNLRRRTYAMCHMSPVTRLAYFLGYAKKPVLMLKSLEARRKKTFGDAAG